MKQNALTLIAPVRSERLEVLRKVLKEKEETIKTALGKLGTIHYARWVIIDGKTLNGRVFSPQLAFSTNFDGNKNQHLEDIVARMDTLLDDIYLNCEDYSPEGRLGYLQKIRVKEAAFYQGAPGRTVNVIAQEKALRDRILKASREGNWEGMSARAIHQKIREEVLAEPEYQWARERIKTPGINWPGLILAGLVLLALAPVIILWAVYIQIFHESRDKPLGLTPNQLSDEHINKMQLDEDFKYQNQFSQIIDMKPGIARLLTVNFLYLFTRILIKVLFVKGKLMGIPTIHFARWVMVNDNKRMLFFSNFDGSWTQYLGDFIDKSGWGLTGIFGNTATFPKSLFLVFKGAYDEEHFLAWSRNTQIQTQIWYTATTNQSIKNINNNTLIRNDLNRSLSEKRAKLFLSRI